MPELPEVETVRAGLEPVLRGRRFINVEQRRPDLRFPLPERFAERLTGRTVERLERRAKYILVHLDGGEVLAVHLGMTGRFSVQLPLTPPLPQGGGGPGGARESGVGSPKGGPDTSSASSRTSTATTPSTTIWCSLCRVERSSPTMMRAASAT